MVRFATSGSRAIMVTDMAHGTKFRICDFMTSSPVVISPDLTLDDARQRMFEREIRHLPVVEADKLVGVVSQRDIALVSAAVPDQADQLTVAAAMTRDVYTCGSEAHIEVIAREMLEHRYGCVVVLGDERQQDIVGIFTAVDAVKALIYFCEPVLKNPDALLTAASSAADKA